MLLAIYNLLGINTKYEYEVAHGRLFPSLKETCQVLLTFILAVIGWIIFRAETMTQAWEYLSRMFSSPFEGMTVGSLRYTFAFVIIMLIAEWIQRDKQHALELVHCKGVLQYRLTRWTVYMGVLALILVFAGAKSQFIYFQF